ncbi:hypothetical protein EG329_003000 [Mollisiaceae sp. DMI_Dod_QoI]|nr:hypothetical protein EG329_003000 [Helotiales sp. DMI_Dod_QoI]
MQVKDCIFLILAFCLSLAQAKALRPLEYVDHSKRAGKFIPSILIIHDDNFALACNRNNCLRALLSPQHSSDAIDFCETYIPAHTVTIPSTDIVTETFKNLFSQPITTIIVTRTSYVLFSSHLMSCRRAEHQMTPNQDDLLNINIHTITQPSHTSSLLDHHDHHNLDNQHYPFIPSPNSIILLKPHASNAILTNQLIHLRLQHSNTLPLPQYHSLNPTIQLPNSNPVIQPLPFPPPPRPTNHNYNNITALIPHPQLSHIPLSMLLF